ncbi:MAG: T9SS type A sorting domain-containing protein [Saprospiraceae bacterium]|nr:T9SS type A sorting domain-containing protein [Saprospiraceae bacterium]
MLKKLTFLLGILALCADHISAQDTHSFQWRFTAGNNANVFLHDALPTDDRGYVCSGLLESPAGSALYFPCLFRVDCRGQVLWAKTFNQPTETPNNVNGRVLQISATDFVLVSNVGFFFTTPHNDIFLARVDGEGNTVWTRRIGGGTNNQDLARAAIVASDGSIVLAGQTGSWGTDAGSGNTYTDQYFMKVSSAGNILWSRTVGNPQKVDRAYDVVELADESLVVAGSYIHTGGTFYANLLKMDKNGTVLWHKVFGEGTAPQANHAYGLTATADGGLLLTGSSTNLQQNFQGYDDFLVVKTDADGEVEWSRVVAGGGPDNFENASSVVQKPNGDFAVMCATNSFPTIGFVGNKYAVLTLSPNGALVSMKTYNGGSSHYPRIRVHPQESGYLISGFTNWTGYGGNGNRFDPLLINTNADLGVGCFNIDYTNFTTVYDPPFDIDDAPGTLSEGGAVINAVVNAASFELTLDVACEQNGYETCAPFSSVAEYAERQQSVEIWPNPVIAGRPVSLRWHDADAGQVTLVDAQGRIVAQHHPVPGIRNLDLRPETPGVYWVHLQGYGWSRTEKMVVLR